MNEWMNEWVSEWVSEWSFRTASDFFPGVPCIRRGRRRRWKSTSWDWWSRRHDGRSGGDLRRQRTKSSALRSHRPSSETQPPTAAAAASSSPSSICTYKYTVLHRTCPSICDCSPTLFNPDQFFKYFFCIFLKSPCYILILPLNRDIASRELDVNGRRTDGRTTRNITTFAEVTSLLKILSFVVVFFCHCWRSETTEWYTSFLQLFLSLATVVHAATVQSSISSPHRVLRLHCFLTIQLMDLQKCLCRSSVLWSCGWSIAVSAFFRAFI